MITQEYDFLKCDYTLEETEDYLYEVARSHKANLEITKIFKALDFAKEAHKSQNRCNKLPFIIHPMRVALMLVRYDRNVTTDVFIAALLHDILENTCLTYVQIEDNFDRYVAKLVQAVSMPHDIKNLQEKCEAKIKLWQKIMLNSHEARAIKTFEDLDNILCWKTIPNDNTERNKIPLWLKEAHEMSLLLAHVTNLQAHELMQQELMYYDSPGYSNQAITI
jgi:(p)ppGpp synthase/HD superfamily hydrolase